MAPEPVPMPDRGAAQETAEFVGIAARGRVTRVTERTGTGRDGATFYTDVITLFSAQGGETSIECSRSRSGQPHPAVAAARQLLPAPGEELGGWLVVPVYPQVFKDRVYWKAAQPQS